MSEQSAFALWDFESSDFGQVSLKVGDAVIIMDEQDDGWCTVEKKGGEMGFVPTAYLDRSKGKRKGTIFGKFKGSSEPAPPVPPFGNSSKKKDDGNKGTRRFAARRGVDGGSNASSSLGEVASRYGGEEKDKEPEVTSSTPTAKATPEPAPSPDQAKSSVGKLNNTWAAKEAAAASEGPGQDGDKQAVKKIVVKKRATPAKDALGKAPVAPPTGSEPIAPIPIQHGAKNTSPRRSGSTTNLISASTPNLGTSAPVAHRPSASNIKIEEPKPVPQETLEELAKMNDRRTNIMREIYETEKSYVKSLKDVCGGYLDPMKDSKWKDLVPKLFSNINMILAINEELLGGLGNLISSWDTTKSLVGPIFLKMAPFMRLYITYGNSYNDALQALAKAKERDDSAQFLEKCRAQHPLDLEALLIQPVQRIPRYRLLLEDLLKNTPSRHPDRENIDKSLDGIRDVANNINESIRASEQQKKVVEQSGLLKYIAPHRRLLQEGSFSVKLTKSGESIKGAIDADFFLFNDLLVMFFAKQVKLKDPRRMDFAELAWPAAVMVVGADGKSSFKISGPGSLSIIASSKDKDAVAAQSQVAGFLQKLQDVLNEYRDPSIVPAWRTANPTAGTRFAKYEFPEGYTYVGEWKNGCQNGRGELSYPGGLRLEGTFDEGLRSGECVIYYPTGEVYTGMCVKDVQHGVGKIVWPNGDEYNGYWLDGRRDGEGTFKCAYYRYTGSWHDGFMEGEGKLEFNGGGYYEGKFKEGKFHGEGVMQRANGTRTKGQWNAGVQEGEGEETYPESWPIKSYQGSFKNDKREGQGCMIYRDGAQYKGEFKDGMRHGRGILTAPQRPIMRYEGMWQADKFEGKGEVFFSSKDRYVGSFSMGCMHGPGVYYYSNGTQVAGEWKQGVRQRKIFLQGSGPGPDEKFELEISCTKDRQELGDVKVNGKSLAYFVTPSKPDLDQSALEQEIVPESQANFVTGKGPAHIMQAPTPTLSSSMSSSSPASATDSPSLSTKNRPRGSSVFSRKKDKE